MIRPDSSTTDIRSIRNASPKLHKSILQKYRFVYSTTCRRRRRRRRHHHHRYYRYSAVQQIKIFVFLIHVALLLFLSIPTATATLLLDDDDDDGNGNGNSNENKIGNLQDDISVSGSSTQHYQQQHQQQQQLDNIEHDSRSSSEIKNNSSKKKNNKDDKNVKKKKAGNTNTNTNSNNDILSLFWDRHLLSLPSSKMVTTTARSNKKIKISETNDFEFINDNNDDRRRIKETLKKLHHLADPRFARLSIAKTIVEQQTRNKAIDTNTFLLPSNEDEKQNDSDDEEIGEEEEEVILLPGTLLQVFSSSGSGSGSGSGSSSSNEDNDDDDDVSPDDDNNGINNNNGQCAVVTYKLSEPVCYELGGTKPQHYMDFAYQSVMMPTTIQSSSEKDDDDVDEFSTCTDIVSNTAKKAEKSENGPKYSNSNSESNSDRNNDALPTSFLFSSSWWRWWLPYRNFVFGDRNDGGDSGNNNWWQRKTTYSTGGGTSSSSSSKTFFNSNYNVDDSAFAGGSNGEVWRGYRVCNEDTTTATEEDTSSNNKSCNDATSLILKRLRVGESFLLLEAGLREIYFGKLIQTQMNDREQNYYTVYVDHFFREAPRRKQRRTNNKVAFGLPAPSSLSAAGAEAEAEADNLYYYPNNNKQEQQHWDFKQHEQRRTDDFLELWIVYEDAGPSLRSYIYTATVSNGFVMYQHSKLWTQLRTATSSLSSSSSSSIQKVRQNINLNNDGIDDDTNNESGKRKSSRTFSSPPSSSTGSSDSSYNESKKRTRVGRSFMRDVLRQILSATAQLHKRGIVHRDIKPSNVMCKSDRPLDDDHPLFDDSSSSTSLSIPTIHCRLGDFSSGWDRYTSSMLYTKGPTSGEQTDEYAPPESFFAGALDTPFDEEKPQSYDSWSIGVLALELLLGTPNVFSVDQRTNAVLTYKMKRAKATDQEIANALYLAALSSFCIYIPSTTPADGGIHPPTLHKTSMVKESCTLQDFHRALRARDPLGIGFDSSTDLLLHLIWQLLAFNPRERMTAGEALLHPYFMSPDLKSLGEVPDYHNAVESQTLDPRIDFHVENDITDFVCPKCGRMFHDWESCHKHANTRKHAKFCTYNHTYLPSCINTHTMLPEHSASGYCDLQGRRSTIEDFHSIHLHHNHQFYGIFDGHTGNLASKYVASELYKELMSRLPYLGEHLTTKFDKYDTNGNNTADSWKNDIRDSVTQSFQFVHEQFLKRISRMTSSIVGAAPKMDQSGTTATVILVTNDLLIVAILGDSRAVLSSSTTTTSTNNKSKFSFPSISAIQFSTDHVASNPNECALVIERGGFISTSGSIPRVNGILAVTRSIGDANLASVLSREPHVLVLNRSEIREWCGGLGKSSNNVEGQKEENKRDDAIPCFVILASDGLWDVMSNQEAVDMVVDVILRENSKHDTTTSVQNRVALLPLSPPALSDDDDRDLYDDENGRFQAAAERLAVEAYVRGSTDNIGVCVVAIN